MSINRIFKLFRTKETDNEIFLLVENAKENYLITLKNIENILRNGKHYAQAELVEKNAVILIDNDYPRFIKEINSINMWGGSGAVWEVYFHEEGLQQKFNIEMLTLIKLMETTKILGNGIKPLKKLFKQ